jgi:phosphoribosylformylglycinamidine cyclo-ligase
VFPKDCKAQIRRGSWPVQPIFSLIKKIGRVDEAEMYRVFNMGIGLVLIVPARNADAVIAKAATFGDTGYRIGEMVSGEPGVEYVG